MIFCIDGFTLLGAIAVLWLLAAVVWAASSRRAPWR